MTPTKIKLAVTRVQTRLPKEASGRAKHPDGSTYRRATSGTRPDPSGLLSHYYVVVTICGIPLTLSLSPAKNKAARVEVDSFFDPMASRRLKYGRDNLLGPHSYPHSQLSWLRAPHLCRSVPGMSDLAQNCIATTTEN